VSVNRWLIGIALAATACSNAPAADVDSGATAGDDALVLTFPDAAVPDADAADAVAAAPDAETAAEDAVADAVAGTDAAAVADTQDTADADEDTAPDTVVDAGCSPGSCPAADSPCSVAVCLADGTCGFAPANDGTACNDANACTTADSCQAGACVGTLKNCDDGNACTIDACKTNVGCVTSFEFAPCEDGDGCTMNDQCISGVCKAGAPMVCTSSDPCQQAGSCEPATGVCSMGTLPNGTNCGQNQICMIGKCTVADAMPADAFAWFNSAECPPGWEADPDAVGRTAVIGDVGTVGQVDGTPLSPGEDRTHTHSVAGSISTSSVSFVGIAGCCNSGLSAAGVWDVSGSALAASTGIPYVQLRGCKKSSASVYGNGPSAMLAFISGTACTSGWVAATASAQRFVVGTPGNGSNGANFGGTWGGSHTHSVSATIPLPSHGIALASGCCGGGYAASGSVGFNGSSGGSGSSFPTITRYACSPSEIDSPGPMPSALVAFFTSATCPSGWSDASSAQGRLIVGAVNAPGVGITVGKPLSDKEDRTHTHAVSASVTPPGKSVAGANGPNGQAADNGVSEGSGSSSANPSGMPFVQWRACQKD
jgi:hypothetical protein